MEGCERGSGTRVSFVRGARRKRMDSLRSTRRVDALHHAAQLLQASLRDADWVLLLDEGRRVREASGAAFFGESGPTAPGGLRRGIDRAARAQEREAGKIRRRRNGRSEKTRFSSVTTRPRRPPLSTRRATLRVSYRAMRLHGTRPRCVSLTVVALLLASPVDAAVPCAPISLGCPRRSRRESSVAGTSSAISAARGRTLSGSTRRYVPA